MNQPLLIGITGTNGKTSVTTMIAQLLNRHGIRAAAIGQRIETPEGVRSRKAVSAGPYGLKNYISQLFSEENIQVFAIEVYSAALAKGLHDSLQYDVAAFTNITHDHYSVHGDAASYLAAKLRLLNRLTRQARLYLDPEAKGLDTIIQQLNDRKLEYTMPDEWQSQLPAAFIRNNANLAATIAADVMAGLTVRPARRSIQAAVNGITLPPGRFERWRLPNQSIVIIDFAHNPDGLLTIIEAAREITDGNGRVFLLLSSKGDWGQIKRQAMADSAATADYVVVTDDDPRHEDPAVIRTQLARRHRYEQITPRSKAIHYLCQKAGKDDVVIVAGRGADDQWDGPWRRTFYNDQAVIKQMKGVLHE